MQTRITSGIHTIDSIECVLVSLHAEEQTGCGYAFCFSADDAAAIAIFARQFAQVVHRRPAHLVRALWRELWDRTNFIGHAGPPLMALSAYDMALWDLIARLAGQPLYRMLGAARDEVRVYAAGGWLSLDVDALCAEAVAMKSAGFTAYKMRAGNRDWRLDVARIEAVREAIGDDIELMVDVNQAWDVATAISAARALEACNLSWLEEPVDAHDVSGCARVAAAVDVPVAAGETVWGPQGLIDLVRADAVDVLQPDLMRCGGITGFLTAAAVAEAEGRRVISHLYTPISAHLMATTSLADYVEYIPGWFDPLFAEAPAIEEGRIRLGAGGGTGIAFAAVETPATG
ncbi:MAG TPA: mandelate racemase/muconate lactonizing enzyme family protein [Solirubrobacteraceae bacterium]